MKPYFEDGQIALYLGDMREVLPKLRLKADLVCADPPYNETSLPWDRWPEGWLEIAAGVTSSLWCFGSLRTFLAHRDEFTAAGWKLSQDTIGEYEIDTMVWEKHNGSGFAADRFKRVHELAAHWYRGAWRDIYHDVPTEHAGRIDGGMKARNAAPTHTGAIGSVSERDRVNRLARSVIRIRSMHRRGIHESEKPLGILDPLIRYASRPGGLVVDPFAGSGSTLDAARASGRRAIGIEAHEPYAEKAARRLEQLTLGGDVA